MKTSKEGIRFQFEMTSDAGDNVAGGNPVIAGVRLPLYYSEMAYRY